MNFQYAHRKREDYFNYQKGVNQSNKENHNYSKLKENLENKIPQINKIQLEDNIEKKSTNEFFHRLLHYEKEIKKLNLSKNFPNVLKDSNLINNNNKIVSFKIIKKEDFQNDRNSRQKELLNYQDNLLDNTPDLIVNDFSVYMNKDSFQKRRSSEMKKNTSLQPYINIDQCNSEKLNFTNTQDLIGDNSNSVYQKKSQSLKSNKRLENQCLEGKLEKKVFFNETNMTSYTKFYPPNLNFLEPQKFIQNNNINKINDNFQKNIVNGKTSPNDIEINNLGDKKEVIFKEFIDINSNLELKKSFEFNNQSNKKVKFQINKDDLKKKTNNLKKKNSPYVKKQTNANLELNQNIKISVYDTFENYQEKKKQMIEKNKDFKTGQELKDFQIINEEIKNKEIFNIIQHNNSNKLEKISYDNQNNNIINQRSDLTNMNFINNSKNYLQAHSNQINHNNDKGTNFELYRSNRSVKERELFKESYLPNDNNPFVLQQNQVRKIICRSYVREKKPDLEISDMNIFNNVENFLNKMTKESFKSNYYIKNEEFHKNEKRNFGDKKSKSLSFFKERMLKILMDTEINKIKLKNLNRKIIAQPDFHVIKSNLLKKIQNSINSLTMNNKKFSLKKNILDNQLKNQIRAKNINERKKNIFEERMEKNKMINVKNCLEVNSSKNPKNKNIQKLSVFSKSLSRFFKKTKKSLNLKQDLYNLPKNKYQTNFFYKGKKTGNNLNFNTEKNRQDHLRYDLNLNTNTFAQKSSYGSVYTSPKFKGNGLTYIRYSLNRNLQNSKTNIKDFQRNYLKLKLENFKSKSVKSVPFFTQKIENCYFNY